MVCGKREKGTLLEFLHGVPRKQTQRLQILRFWHLAQGLFNVLLSDGVSCVWALSLDVGTMMTVQSSYVWNYVSLVDVVLYKCIALDDQPCLFILSAHDIELADNMGTEMEVQDNGLDMQNGVGKLLIWGKPVLEVCCLTRSHEERPTEDLRRLMDRDTSSRNVFKQFGGDSVVEDNKHKEFTNLRVHVHSMEVDDNKILKELVMTDGSSLLSAVCSLPINVAKWEPGDVVQVLLSGASIRESKQSICDITRLAACSGYKYKKPSRSNKKQSIVRYSRTSIAFSSTWKHNKDTLEYILRHLCASELSVMMLVNRRFLASIMAMHMHSPYLCIVPARRGRVTSRMENNVLRLLTQIPNNLETDVSLAAQLAVLPTENMRVVLGAFMPNVYRRFSEMQTEANMNSAVNPVTLLTSMVQMPQHNKCNSLELGIVPYEHLAMRLREFFPKEHEVSCAQARPVEHIYAVLRTIITKRPSTPLQLQYRQARLHNPGIQHDQLEQFVELKNEVFGGTASFLSD